MKKLSLLLLLSFLILAIGCVPKVIAPSEFNHGNKVEQLVKTGAKEHTFRATVGPLNNCIVTEICKPLNLIFYKSFWGDIHLEYDYEVTARLDTDGACAGGGYNWPRYQGKVRSDVKYSGNQVFFTNITDNYSMQNRPDLYYGGIQLKAYIEGKSGSELK